MTLTNRRDFPPKGYQFYEPAINWRAPQDLATQGLKAVALALQKVRAQNPQVGLDPSLDACINAICEFTCARLAPWPELQRQFCDGGEQTDQERLVSATRRKALEQPRGCPSCGRR
jgi:hypothetical protein